MRSERRHIRDERTRAGRYLDVRLLFLASSLVATACTPSPAPRTRPAPAPAPRARAKPYPAALYAGLFVKGARYRYAVEATREYGADPDAPGTGEERFTGTITCTVTEVVALPSATASRFECDNPAGLPLVGDGPAGIYVATAEGLWSVPELPRVTPTDPEARLFTWPPVAGETAAPDPANPGWGTNIVISQDGAGGWCRYLTFVSGDEGDATICVRDGIVTVGGASSSGGSSYAMTYTLVRK